MKKGLTLKDLEPEVVANRETEEKEEQKIMAYLANLSSQMLMEELRENWGHPRPCWGDKESWRCFFIKECRRRGAKLLEDMGWPLDNEAEYRNLHTGNVNRLIDVANPPSKHESDDPIGEDAWSIVEHWEPCQARKTCEETALPGASLRIGKGGPPSEKMRLTRSRKMDQTVEPEDLKEISLVRTEEDGVLHELASLNHNNRCRQATLEGFMDTGAG